MIKKLRVKFVCINMAIVTVMLAVIFGMIVHSTQVKLEEQSDRMMESVLSSNLTGGQLALPSLPALRPGVQSQEVQLPFFYVAVNAYGRVTLAQSGYFDISDGEDLQNILRLALESEEDRGLLNHYNLRFMKRDTPRGQSLVFVDISSELATIRGMLRTLAGIGILSLSAFFGVSVLLARWTVRPVEQAWNQQKQFVADASHELKTPLTVIMTNAELLTDPEYGEDQRGQFVSSILAMSHQMRGLVESLLELARVDNGTAKMEFTRLDLGELAEDATLPFEPVYFEKGLTLDSQVEKGLFVRGSAAHLRQTAEILLDNAAKYSTPGGEVRVRVRRQGNGCVLSVDSSGDPIAREDLKNIFKRFYRVDKARTSDGSFGLGLAIAESIVKEHGGKIWAESAEGRNVFSVWLPGD